MANKLSEQELEILREVERGKRLDDTVRTAGWQDALDILEDLVAQSEHHLIKYNGTDPLVLASLHARARRSREIFQTFQARVMTAVNGARGLLLEATSHDPLTEGHSEVYDITR